MYAAIFGLFGVLVGALASLTATYVLRLRDEYADAFVATRLIVLELQTAREKVLCNLPLSEVLDVPIWRERQAALAVVLPPDFWEIVEHAYLELAKLPRAGASEVRDRELERALTAAIDGLKKLSGPEGALRRRRSRLEWNVTWPDA